MEFDFTNYAYSALITIFSMIMGMAYPLVNSTIGDIDKKYESICIVQSFLREKCYRNFQVSLALSVIAAIVSPFILLCFSGYSSLIIVWTVIHTLIVLLLIISAIRLYQTLMEYKLPNSAAERFSRRIGHDDNIILVAEVARFAARKNLSELYLNCTQTVYEEIANQMANGIVQMSRSAMYIVPGMESRLREADKKAIGIYSSIICDEKIKWGLYKTDISIVATLFSIDKPLLEGDRLLIWRFVSEAVKSGNEKWLKAYWTQATQYISFFDQTRHYWDMDSKDRRKCDEEKRGFKRMHIAMIGMIMEYGKLSYVDALLYHSRTLPYSYPLCDNTFRSLYEDWEGFYCDESIYMQINQLNQYPIDGLNGNIDDEKRLISIIEKSLALQLIRLNGIDYNAEHANPLELIATAATIAEKQYQLRMLSRMQEAVNRLFDEGLETAISGRRYFSKTEALDFINKNISEINGILNQVINNPAIDEKKKNDLISKLKEKWEADHIHYREAENYVAYSTKMTPHSIDIDIPDSYILSGYSEVNYDDFVDAIINSIRSNVERSSASSFDYHKPKQVFRIQYHDVGKALERLCVNANYMILCNDFYIDRFFDIYKSDMFRAEGGKRYFNDAEMIEMNAPATCPFIIVIKKSLLPYIEIGEYAESGLSSISESPFLYSNLPTIDVNTYKHTQIKFMIKINIPTNIEYIKLTMPYKSGDMDLYKIKPLA